jgi:hypothetical protein
MTEVADRTLTADTLVLGIPAFTQRTPQQQLALRQHLSAVLTATLGTLPPADRIVLETASGAAVVFLGDPGTALATARALRPLLSRNSDGVASLRVALNRGPVRLAASGGGLGVTGDTLAVAETLADFAQPGQIIAARAFRDAAGADASFRMIGMYTDAAVRVHEVFLFDPATSPASDDGGGFSIRRRAVVTAVAAAALLIAGGFGTRAARQIIAAQRQPGVIRLAVRPVADVVVDSAFKGRTPPLKTVELPAGWHTVELRRAGHPTRNVEVALKPGEAIEIQHTFFDKPRAKTLRERLGL